MGRPTKAFQRFDVAVRTLLAVPKDECKRLHAQHREEAAKNRRNRGAKPKATPLARDPAGDDEAS